MSVRFTAIGALLAGTLVGLGLLFGGAPLWAFFLAPLGVFPVLFAYLEAGRRDSTTRHHDGALAHLIAPLGLTSNVDNLGEVPPEDPYVSVMTLHGPEAALSHQRRSPNSLYVISNPDEREWLRINTLHRLGLNTVIVTKKEDTGTEMIRHDAPGLVSKIHGSDVLIGIRARSRRDRTAMTTLRGSRRLEPRPTTDA